MATFKKQISFVIQIILQLMRLNQNSTSFFFLKYGVLMSIMLAISLSYLIAAALTEQEALVKLVMV